MQNLVTTLKSGPLTARGIAIWLPFLLTVATCPLLIRLSPLVGLFDNPAESSRKIHGRTKPLGGPALFVGIIPMLAVYSDRPLPLVASASLVFSTGLIDDITGLGPKVKLLLQLVAAGVAVAFLQLPSTDLLPGLKVLEPLGGLPNSVLLTFWLVGGTNAFNLIDGLDGLAAGIGIITLMPLLVLTYGGSASLLIGGLVAALAGLLLYNFYPAKLFLGDGGSYLVGFLAALLTIVSLSSAAGPGSSEWPLTVGILLLGFPVLDTLLAIARRALSGKGILEADQRHVHHVLYRKFGHPRAVLAIYLLQLLSVGLGLFLFL